MRGRFFYRWRRFWIRYAGRGKFGRIAAFFAAWKTNPYHGRAFLADNRPDGFIVHSAVLAHPDFRMGAHVYVGDRVVVSCGPDTGPVELEDRVQIYGDTLIHTAWNGRITIGSGTHIQPGCHIYSCLSEIRIGRRVEIAARCAFYSYNHGVAPGVVIMDQPLESKGRISVGDGAWLGHGVIVLNGVEIGAGAVIGAGSVVIRDIPENAIAAGVPARVIRFRGDAAG